MFWACPNIVHKIKLNYYDVTPIGYKSMFYDIMFEEGIRKRKFKNFHLKENID